VLSGFRPAATLRANTGGPGGSGALRTALVVLQFAVSIGLGISAVVIFSQIQFARGLDLGFRHDNIVVVDGNRLGVEGRDSFEHALAAGPGIAAVARSNTLPFTGFTDATGLQVPGNPQLFTPNRDVVSPEFFALYRIKLLAGRMLSRQRSEDVFQDIYQTGKIERNNGRNILVSAMTARQLGFGTQGAVGKTVLMGKAHVKIVGVVSDVLFRGANSEVVPRVYVYAGEAAGVFSVRVSGDMPAALAYIDRTWHSFLPNLFNSRSLLDDKFARLYAADQRQGKIFGIFVAIAIFIAGLGLFGLAAFTAGRRTKEIGVRKVFGAHTRDVVFLLLWQFSIPVLLANLIAWPLAWYYLHGWLQSFAYRIPLNPLYFIGTGLAALLIAWATIFTHAWRVARANPIHALRTE
jgi:putative ABC transport system permease protein